MAKQVAVNNNLLDNYLVPVKNPHNKLENKMIEIEGPEAGIFFFGSDEEVSVFFFIEWCCRPTCSPGNYRYPSGPGPIIISRNHEHFHRKSLSVRDRICIPSFRDGTFLLS